MFGNEITATGASYLTHRPANAAEETAATCKRPLPVLHADRGASGPTTGEQSLPEIYF